MTSGYTSTALLHAGLLYSSALQLKKGSNKTQHLMQPVPVNDIFKQIGFAHCFESEAFHRASWRTLNII